MKTNELPCMMSDCIKADCFVPYCKRVAMLDLDEARFESMKSGIKAETDNIVSALIMLMCRLAVTKDKGEFVGIRDCLNRIKANLYDLEKENPYLALAACNGHY
jgi:hypothetical protein